MNDPIQKSVTVPLSPAEAFALFTSKIDTWWPGKTHSVSAYRDKKPKKVTFEDRKNGKIKEITDEGDEQVWGTILAYDPGEYLAFTWHPGKSEDEATVVTVSFKETAEGTQCDLIHGGFDILGDLADAVSTSYLKGWDLVLGSYTAAAKGPVFA
ncbi:SRPBCC family protein [Yoonia sp. 2307UL14-13]|uniref:SRPBCC family protein n=1 Tax=Yoonia sp. 2307UL14-13 TaxID=3126506 RepID=UPI0030A94382